MDLAGINDGLVSALRTIADVRVYDWEPEQPEPPCVFPILPDQGNYDADMQGGVELSMTVRVLVSWADQRSAIAKIQPYLATDGASSIKVALEDEPTLGGQVDDLRVVGWSALGRITYGTIDALGCDLTIAVLA